MSKIELAYKHNLSKEEISQKIDSVFQKLLNKSDYFQFVSPKWNSDRTEFSFKGESFSGVINLSHDLVNVTMKLDGMMSMFRPIVEQKINEIFEKEMASN